jgi:predicted nucleotidyltransferase
MTKNLKTHITVINKNLSTLRSKFKVKRIAIFGSTARGDNKKNSDIDVMVEFDEPISFFTFIELENYLSKILGAKVDLTTKKAIKQTIKKEILKELIYA